MAPEKTTIVHAKGVVCAPMGSHPFKSPGFYSEDLKHLFEYREAAKAFVNGGNPDPFRAYLDKYIYGPETHLDYLDTMSAKHLFKLYK
jgi:glutaconate CoA-transferase subunit A